MGRELDIRVTVNDDRDDMTVIADIILSTKTVQCAVVLNTMVTPPIEYDETRQKRQEPMSQMGSVAIAELTGQELSDFLAEIDPHIHTLRFAIDGGLKYKVNEYGWSPPKGTVREVPNGR